MAGARASAFVVRKVRAEHIVRIALAVYLISALVLLGMSVAGMASLVPTTATLFVIIALLGFLRQLSSMLAMESVGAIAGTAAALMGAFQFGAGALSSAVMGAFSDGSTWPLAVCIFVCGLASVLLSLLAFPKYPAEMGAR